MANISKSEIARFLEDSVNDLQTSDGTCTRYILDGDLALYVGWEDGFSPNDKSVIHDNDEPTWGLCAKIADRNEYLWADYEFNYMPYDVTSNEVYDTDTTISPNEDYNILASIFIKEYNNIRKELDDGTLALEESKRRNRKARRLSENNSRNYKTLYLDNDEIRNRMSKGWTVTHFKQNTKWPVVDEIMSAKPDSYVVFPKNTNHLSHTPEDCFIFTPPKGEPKSEGKRKRTIKESVDKDNTIWSSNATHDYWMYEATDDDVMGYFEDSDWEDVLEDYATFDDNGNVIEYDIDALRDIILDREVYYDWNMDKEDLVNNIIPEIKKQCYDGHIWLLGNYQRWDGGHHALGYSDDVEKYIEEICYPDYDANTVLYKDGKDIVFTEYSHDAPMGGTSMKLYSFKDKNAFDSADSDNEDGADGIYYDSEDIKTVEDWIKKGYLTPVTWQW